MGLQCIYKNFFEFFPGTFDGKRWNTVYGENKKRNLLEFRFHFFIYLVVNLIILSANLFL
jgi:hypothetical protein